MDDHRTSLEPEAAERRFANLLDGAKLPRFTSSRHDPVTREIDGPMQRTGL